MLRYKADGSTNANYWLASRAVSCGSGGGVTFFMRRVYSGDVSSNRFYDSIGGGGDGFRGVRPVVSLESGVQLTKKVGDTWNLGK